MLRKDEGVVLRSARSGESSTLVTFFGRQGGKIRLLGKGALTSKSPFRGLLDVGNLIEAVYYHKEGRTLYFLKEVQVHSTLAAARESLSHLASALGILELLDKICYWGSPEERVVDLWREYMNCRSVVDAVCLYLAFALKLLDIFGVTPDFSSCASCNGAVTGGYYHPADGTSLCQRHSSATAHRTRLTAPVLATIAAMRAGSLSHASDMDVDPSDRKELGKIVHWTYTFHIQDYSLPRALKLMPKAERA